MNPQVGIIMGSQSDLPIMAEAAAFLDELGVSYELTIVSAHRTPQRMIDYAESARQRGLRVIVAGAGGAAHLPGMVASLTSLPVVGVPIKSSNSIDGWDSILSILQMPSGIPVGILAASIVGSFDMEVAAKMDAFKKTLKEKVEKSALELERNGWKATLNK